MTSSVFTQEMERQAMTDFTGMFDRWAERLAKIELGTYYTDEDQMIELAEQIQAELKAFREQLDDNTENAVFVVNYDGIPTEDHNICEKAWTVLFEAASLVAQADKGE